MDSASPMPGGGDASLTGLDKSANKTVRFLRECLLLLAIQVVTVSYVAGLNPPGGVWPDTKDGHLTGDPILARTDHVRYNAFSCSNTTALMASAAVVLLLLFVRGKSSELPWFNTVLRTVMSLATLALAVAYAAGAIFASVLVALLFIPIVVIFTIVWIFSPKQGFSKASPQVSSRAMLTAMFVMTTAYTVGLSPPGALWLDTQEGHRAGDPALPAHHRNRFTAFFVGNTMAFVASLIRIPLVLTEKSFMKLPIICNFIAQSGLMTAYAAGSSIKAAYIAYVILSGGVTDFLVLTQWYIWPRIWKPVKEWLQKAIGGSSTSLSHDGMHPFFMLLFTTLSAAVTYQAGLNPPGGLWLDDLDGHRAGVPILLAKQPTRYRLFIYCNSMALVASMVAIVMALTERCQTRRSRALDGLMVLDLIGLIGAFAAGCCRDVKTSIYVISLGGAVVVYVVFHMAFLTKQEIRMSNKYSLFY